MSLRKGLACAFRTSGSNFTRPAAVRTYTSPVTGSTRNEEDDWSAGARDIVESLHVKPHANAEQMRTQSSARNHPEAEHPKSNRHANPSGAGSGTFDSKDATSSIDPVQNRQISYGVAGGYGYAAGDSVRGWNVEHNSAPDSPGTLSGSKAKFPGRI
ncbi:hypothetical protein BC832DRAFT_554960 [Gaertneriomyces semiglobifer]|nr:hypothetical protein BC832DRAFT_554960 [Gaertneriomyces semiglobifer]